MSLGIAVIVAAISSLVAVPLLMYHFLIFPNIDGVVQDLSWYHYDNSSQHFLYWMGFYASGTFGGILCSLLRTSK